MKEVRIFVASSRELIAARNALAYFTLAHEDEFTKRGFRVRLAKWEYVDGTMGPGRTEDRYLTEMRDSDGALILYANVCGKFTEEERQTAREYESSGGCRLKAHRILFKEGPDVKPDPDLRELRACLDPEECGTFTDRTGLEREFLEFVEKVSNVSSVETSTAGRTVTAFLVADAELTADRDAFADALLNLNDILDYRNIRMKVEFYPSGISRDECCRIAARSEMMIVLYDKKIGIFGRDEIESVYRRTCRGECPKKLYVFFRTEDDGALSPEFRTFRDSFVKDFGHFVGFWDNPDSLRLNYFMSLERYVGETIEVFSTVETPTAPKFVGREKELRRLHELFSETDRYASGRMPLVTGAGGTGKSELIRVYASQFRAKYPGGVFQVDAEHVTDWDGVFRGILKRSSNNGVRVRDYLGLDSKAERDNGSPAGGDSEYSSEAIRAALLKTARQKGPILIFLDNVEDVYALFGDYGDFNEAFPAGFSEKVCINVIATARVCDATPRDDAWHIELSLGDLSANEASELILGTRPVGDLKDIPASELVAVDEIAKLLGYRALFLRRVSALVGDLHSNLMCDTYSELLKALRENLLVTVDEGLQSKGAKDEAHFPAVLWQLTCDRLKKLPLGPECIKLAQVASFFSPDGFALHILRHLWKAIIAPKYEQKFNRAIEILCRFNIFQTTTPVRIHRIDRVTIQKGFALDSQKTMSLVATLSDYGLLSKDDWLTLYGEHTEFRANLPKSLQQDGDFWVKLLCVHPELSDVCCWDVLGGYDWVKLLVCQSNLSGNCVWEKLNGENWSKLLVLQPNYAGHCNWGSLNGTNWVELLSSQPQFGDRCPWQMLDGGEWCSILSAQPQFARYCSWGRLNTSDFATLICSQKQFADRCPWDSFTGWDWSEILISHPHFADRCRWDRLDGYDWASLLVAQPQFERHCHWARLTGHNWAELLSIQVQFASKCKWSLLTGFDWSVLLSSQPQFADCYSWESLEDVDWALLLANQPQFISRCPWDSLSGEDWSALVQLHPELAERCPWEKFNGWDWFRCIVKRLEFADRCDWSKLSGEQWSLILIMQPQLAVRCLWEKLDGKDWMHLLSSQPQFANKCQWAKLDEEDWVKLLEEQPNLAMYRDSGNAKRLVSMSAV